MKNKNPRLVALVAIYSVAVKKKSLSCVVYPVSDCTPLIKSWVFGSIRFYHQLNDIVSKLLKHPVKKIDIDIHCLILLGVYQILYSNVAIHAIIFETVNAASALNKTWAKGLVNAILRQISTDKNILLANTHYSHPSWLTKKIKQDYPHDFEHVFSQNNIQAPMSIRINLSYNLNKYQQTLATAAISTHKIKVAPQALVLDKAISVFELAQFEQGSCYVQDPSAQLAAPLLNPKDSDLILDACAAPGGKATHLAELAPKANIIALDFDKHRLIKIEENIKRLNIKNVSICHGDAQYQDWWNGELFNKILLDAPCSATGVIRRHPDIKLLRKAKDITKSVLLQSQILDNLWSILKPGGILLYATCSILKSENETQISHFLANHNDAKEIKINLDWGVLVSVGRQKLPSTDFDGFYYAKIKKLKKCIEN